MKLKMRTISQYSMRLHGWCSWLAGYCWQTGCKNGDCGQMTGRRRCQVGPEGVKERIYEYGGGEGFVNIQEFLLSQLAIYLPTLNLWTLCVSVWGLSVPNSQNLSMTSPFNTEHMRGPRSFVCWYCAAQCRCCRATHFSAPMCCNIWLKYS